MSEDLKCKECGEPILVGELCWEHLAEKLEEEKDRKGIDIEPPF